MRICGREINVGDYVKVEYMTGVRMKGGTIKGTVTKLWDDAGGLLQAQVDNGWCFHDCDKILEHTKGE